MVMMYRQKRDLMPYQLPIFCSSLTLVSLFFSSVCDFCIYDFKCKSIFAFLLRCWGFFCVWWGFLSVFVIYLSKMGQFLNGLNGCFQLFHEFMTCRWQVKLKLLSITFFSWFEICVLRARFPFIGLRNWPPSKTNLILRCKCIGNMLLQ